MPRLPRADIAGFPYHILNRSIAGLKIFSSKKDFAAFEDILFEARERVGILLYAYIIMPNHWHFIVEPRSNGDIAKFMHWLTVTHTARWNKFHGVGAAGHLYQGRYKCFPIQTDEYFVTACRYVERNALRAKLVPTAQEWRWSSLWIYCNGNDEQKARLDKWPIYRENDWVKFVNKELLHEQKTLSNLRECTRKGRPFGDHTWSVQTAERLGIDSSFRGRGRPKKK